MNAVRGEPSGRLSIAVTAWVVLTFLPETVERFRAKMPEIQLESFEGLLAIATPRLRDGTLDVHVGRQAPGATSCDFLYQPLFASSRAVVARLDHARAECPSLAELLDADWLLHCRQHHAYRRTGRRRVAMLYRLPDRNDPRRIVGPDGKLRRAMQSVEVLV
ncbi:LysR substrate-binding domain-containing protein [Paraburkholderia dilworthii]|uniref:LysR substrate-binding domain-containing protein n=1 Tax=Paraburkholderia dilworthii TaxID=948106 RepID=UPI0004100A6B|nr:LysR substrate-binding domain-containing protein [Paraburkholderia dilworthii]